MMMLELQQSIFSIQVSAVCLHFVQTELRVFISCLLYLLLSGETKWLYILKQTQAAITLGVPDKNIFSVTFRRVELQVRRNMVCLHVEQQNKTGTKSFRVYHSPFTLNSRPSTRTVWMQCEINMYFFKCVAARVWYYFRNSPAPCFLITNIGRPLTLGREAIQKTLNIFRKIEYVSLYPRWPPCLR